MTHNFCLLLLALGLASSCQTSVPASQSNPAPAVEARTAPDANLRNTRWVLRTLQNRAITTPANGEAYLLLRNEEARAEGHAGCNRFRGSFEAPASGQLRFGPLLTTRMACLDSTATRTETTFLAALAATRTYQINGDTLRLYAEQPNQPAAVLHAVYLH